MKHAVLLLAVAALSGCSSDGGSPANCSVPRDAYAALDAERVIISADSDAIWTVWRTADGLVYVLRSDGELACIEHAGREMKSRCESSELNCYQGVPY
jgi:hypothetical protein